MRGSGIITSSGDDLAGIYREMGVPLRETFSVCNGLPWLATLRRPDLFLWQEWAVVKRGDPVDDAIRLAAADGIRYDLELTIAHRFEPVIDLYHRTGDAHQAPPMTIPFTKAHGARNDFLLTWERDAPGHPRGPPWPAPSATATRAWARTAGCWSPRPRTPMPMAPSSSTIPTAARPRSPATERAAPPRFSSSTDMRPEVVRIRTGAGVKTLRLLRRSESGIRI